MPKYGPAHVDVSSGLVVGGDVSANGGMDVIGELVVGGDVTVSGRAHMLGPYPLLSNPLFIAHILCCSKKFAFDLESSSPLL